jgi:hypothetical protein
MAILFLFVCRSVRDFDAVINDTESYEYIIIITRGQIASALEKT